MDSKKEKVENDKITPAEETISKPEYDQLIEKYNALNSDHEKLIKAFNKLATDHNNLYISSLFKD